MRFFSAPRISRAFTLVEVMVVVAIIGILTAIVTVHFGQARASTRDDIRKTDLKSLQLALEQFKAQNGQYPAAGCGQITKWTGPGTHNPVWGNDVHCPEYIVGLTPDYISVLPSDPLYEMDYDRGFIYLTNASRSDYKVMVHASVERKFVTSYNDPFARCPRSFASPKCGTTPPGAIYSVYSRGAEDW